MCSTVWFFRLQEHRDEGTSLILAATSLFRLLCPEQSLSRMTCSSWLRMWSSSFSMLGFIGVLIRVFFSVYLRWASNCSLYLALLNDVDKLCQSEPRKDAASGEMPEWLDKLHRYQEIKKKAVRPEQNAEGHELLHRYLLIQALNTGF